LLRGGGLIVGVLLVSCMFSALVGGKRSVFVLLEEFSQWVYPFKSCFVKESRGLKTILYRVASIKFPTHYILTTPRFTTNSGVFNSVILHGVTKELHCFSGEEVGGV
jgi:hypothetical protein